MVIPSNNIRPFVQAYTNSENWRYINDLEDYKWYEIRHFQEHFFEKGVPFPTRLSCFNCSYMRARPVCLSIYRQTGP